MKNGRATTWMARKTTAAAATPTARFREYRSAISTGVFDSIADPPTLDSTFVSRRLKVTYRLHPVNRRLSPFGRRGSNGRGLAVGSVGSVRRGPDEPPCASGRACWRSECNSGRSLALAETPSVVGTRPVDSPRLECCTSSTDTHRNYQATRAHAHAVATAPAASTTTSTRHPLPSPTVVRL